MRKWISAVDACSQTNFRTPKIFPCFELLYVFCLIYLSVLYICKVAHPGYSPDVWRVLGYQSKEFSSYFQSFFIQDKEKVYLLISITRTLLTPLITFMYQT